VDSNVSPQLELAAGGGYADLRPLPMISRVWNITEAAVTNVGITGRDIDA
jgi:hypothetical protein